MAPSSPPIPVRVAIIGLGRSGWAIHARRLASMTDRFQVAAVVDAEPTRRAAVATHLGCDSEATFEAALARDDLDVVVIATPSHTHVEQGLAALHAGKHVVLEKPMASTVEQIDELTAASNAVGRVVTCFHNNRFEGSLQVVRGLIDEGRIGDPVLIRRCVHRYARRRDWQTLSKLDGGELNNHGSHYLDQLLSLRPDADATVLAADMRRTVSAGDAEDHAKILVQLSNGPLLDIESSTAVALPQPAWFVVGTAGTITGTPTSLQVRWLDPALLPDITADSGPALDLAYTVEEDLPWQSETIEVPVVDRTAAFYTNLYEVLHGESELAITPASVRRQTSLLAEARCLSPTLQPD